MSLASFTPRSLSAVMNDLGDKRVNFLLNSIFKRRNTHVTDTIDIGKLTADARIVPYTRKHEPAVPVNKLAGSLGTLVAPIIRTKKVLDEDFFATLNPGMTSYQGPYTDPNTQAADKIALELDDLRRRTDKTIEKAAAEALSTGSITITYEDASNLTLSMGYTGDGATAGESYTIQPTLSGTDAWSASTSKKLVTISELARQIRAFSDWDGMIDVIMGYKACREFTDDAKIQKLLDTKSLNIGSLSLTEQAAFKGVINGMRIWEYQGGYISGTVTLNAIWDPWKIAAIPAGSDAFSVEFGAVFEREAPGQNPKFIRTEYFSKINQEEEPPVSELISESRPIPVVRNPRAVRVQTVGADA